MRTDRIDILQMHGWDGTVPLEETLSALDTLVRDGKVRYVGVSNWSAWHLMKALGISERDGLPRFVCQQIYYSLQAREAEYELVPRRARPRRGDLGVEPPRRRAAHGEMAARVSASHGGHGGCSGGRTPRSTTRRALWSTIDVLVEIADARGCGVPQVALAYLLHKPGVVSLIIGARTEEQLAENLPAADLTLEPEEMRRLDDVSAPPLLYPYWWQAKYDERLGDADLALLGRYRDVPVGVDGLHRPLPGFDVSLGRS